MSSSTDWHDQAACVGEIPDLFSPNEHGGDSFDRYLIKEAKVVCAQCPVRAQCLEWALDSDNRVEHGIWGGTTARERRKIIKTRSKIKMGGVKAPMDKER